MLARPRGPERLGCANLAHATAALPAVDKLRIVAERAPNIGVVTAYNDMLSAHQPYERFPAVIRAAAHRLGATAQVAGGVPAMCDGVTQGRAGMELSLFSRDTIAMGTAVALSHDVFDAALLLGICDKIVPGLLIGALHFGHLPCVFVPGGPMSSGLANSEKTKVREQYALGKVGRDALYAAESASYHGPGTCTFYGTANSNQMLLEAMGLHVPGAAFVHPHAELRDELTAEAVRLVLANAGWAEAAAGGEARAHADRPAGRRADDRQRHGRAARHRRLDQPPDPLGGGGALGRHRHRLDRLLRAVAPDAAGGPRLSERQRRRQPVPGGRRARVRDPRAARGRLPARRRRHRRRRRPRRLHPRAAARGRPPRLGGAARGERRRHASCVRRRGRSARKAA